MNDGRRTATDEFEGKRRIKTVAEIGVELLKDGGFILDEFFLCKGRENHLLGVLRFFDPS